MLPAFQPFPLLPVLAQAGGLAVARRAEGITGGALGVVAPVAAFRLVAEGRGALAQGSFNLGLAVAGDAHPHGNHGIHSGQIDLAALLALQHVLAVALVGIEGAAGGRCKRDGGAGGAFLVRWALAGQPLVLRVDPAGQGQGFDALPPLGLEQCHFGIAAVFLLMLGLAVLIAGGAVRVDGPG